MPRVTINGNATVYVLELDDDVIVLATAIPEGVWDIDVIDCRSASWLPSDAPPRTSWSLLDLYRSWVSGDDDFLADVGIRVVSITEDGKPAYRHPETVRSPRQEAEV